MGVRSILLVTLIFIGHAIFSQTSIGPSDLSSINVNELSDDEIVGFMAQAEEGGYTLDQVYLLARSRGMSENQISALKLRIERIKNSPVGANKETATGIKRLRTGRNDLTTGDVQPELQGLDPFSLLSPKDSIENFVKLKIFGMTFFSNGLLTFEPSMNIPTPDNYILGPGDGLFIDIWGSFEYSYDLIVTPEGTIRVEDVGPIYVGGLTVTEASKRVKNKLKSIYSSLGQDSFAEISLGKLRTINVNVVGEVKLPGTYSTTSFASAFNALYLAMGPSSKGSLRRIEIYRNSQKFATMDAYDYLVRGGGDNITLQDQDIILVKPYQNRVSLFGEVKRPAIYEMLEGETLSDLLEIAGGFNELAYTDRITMRRNTGNFKAVSTVEQSEFDEFKINNGDIIEVKSITNLFTNRVTIEGAVFQPGEYQLQEDLTVGDLLKESGGLRGDAFLGRAIVLRLEDDFSLSSISLNLGDSSHLKRLLKNEDILKIQSVHDLREEQFVKIQGEILNPGKYPFVLGQSVEDLVFLAGGFKESAARSFVEIARRKKPEVPDATMNQTAEIYNFPINGSLELNKQASSFQLQVYDLIVIRKSPFYEEQITVEINGEVLYPGMYALSKKNESISDVIARAGGLTSFAYEQGASLVRRTEYYGEAEKRKNDEAQRKNKYLGNSISADVSDIDLSEQAASEVRRQELESLLKRDTLVGRQEIVLKEQETVGINLNKILEAPGSEFDLILKDGDIVNVPRELQTVRIRGEVLYPSKVRFSKSFNFKDFISQAGGFNQRAKKSNSYVIYPNGTAERTRSLLWIKDYPKVQPGAEIIVPEKPARRKLSPGEILGITSGLASLSLVVLQLVNLSR